MKLKFPVVENDRVWPTNSICPICGKAKIGEDGTFAVFMLGALKKTGEDSATISDELLGFADLFWHASDKDPDGCKSVSIISNAKSGQADLYFCTTNCLRKFFNLCVDELENKRSPDNEES